MTLRSSLVKNSIDAENICVTGHGLGCVNRYHYPINNNTHAGLHMSTNVQTREHHRPPQPFVPTKPLLVPTPKQRQSKLTLTMVPIEGQGLPMICYYWHIHVYEQVRNMWSNRIINAVDRQTVGYICT